MIQTHTFLDEFHNLNGTTVAEKKRNLFQLFNDSNLEGNEIALQAITSQLEPRTHLERLFRVDFLIHYRRFPELFQEFLSGDEIVVSKISKQKWFFEQAFNKIGPQFVETLLPTVSYSLRLKVLRKLVPILTEQQGDVIFDGLVTRYGLFIATNVLVCCSSVKIEHVLRNQPVKLWTSQLKLLYKKNPELIAIYFEERVKHEGDAKFLNGDSFLTFIASKNSDLYIHLQDKYKFTYAKIGKRSTKKIVKAKKESILAQPDCYVQNLKLAVLVRTLGPDFKQVYFKLFPRIFENVCNEWGSASQMLRYYPKRYQYQLFSQTFHEVFFDKLDPNEYVLGLIEDGEEREKLARIKMEENVNDCWIKFYRSANCISAIKQKFGVTHELNRRIENVAIMTESCLINNDKDALIEVLQLLCKRFKNDSKSLQRKFLEILLISKYKHVLNQFDFVHWDYIKEIIKITGHFDNYWLSSTTILFKYFEIAHKNCKLTEEEILIQLHKSDWTQKLDKLKTINSASERFVLLALIKGAPRVVTQTDTIEHIDVRLILAVKNFNKRHVQEKINIFDYSRLLESVKKAMVDDSFGKDKEYLVDALASIICTENNSVEELRECYWNMFGSLANPSVIVWFLKHRPEFIVRHMEKFISVTVSGQFVYPEFERPNIKPIWRMIKCYNHLGIDRQLVDFCTTRLNGEESESVAEPLSVLLPVRDFINIVTTNEADRQFEVQRRLLKNLVQVSDPESAVTAIIQFLNGDHARSCFSCLHSCLYRIPENRVEKFLEQLCCSEGISAKKHGFYFVCVTQTETKVLNSLRKCQLTQSLAMSYRHFVKNPSEQSWDIVSSKLMQLNNDDHFTIMLLINTPAPKNYKSRYFKLAFQIFRSKKNRFTRVLLDKVKQDTVAELDSAFFVSLVDDFLLFEKSELLFCHYMLFSQDTNKLETIFRALRVFKTNNWTVEDPECKRKLYDFVSNFLITYADSEMCDEALSNRFVLGFREVFAPAEAIEEFITLQMMAFKNHDTVKLSKSLFHLNNNFVRLYDRSVISIVGKCFNRIFLHFFKENDLSEFCYTLLDFKTKLEDVLLIIFLLPARRPQIKQTAEFYYKTIEQLKQVADDSVQMHLHLHFKQQKM